MRTHPTIAIRASLLALSAAPLLAACAPAASDAPPSHPAAPATRTAETTASTADEAALTRAEAAIGKLGKTLSSHLMAAMKEGGPPQALEICASKAQDLTQQAASAEQVTLGRASLGLRNPANAGPEWVRAWLQPFGPGKGVGHGATASVLREVVDTDAGRMARVIKPITLGEKCLACHGSEVTPEISQLLGERYPNDDARGYQAGDLRGAFWAEVPVR